MPKEIYNQTDFSGGVNGIDSPRDVVDTQVIRSNSVTFDEKGRIRMMGKAVIALTQGTDKAPSGFVPGTGFFYFTHDWKMINANSTVITPLGSSDEEESEYYVHCNKQYISIYQTSHSSWVNNAINMGGFPPASKRIVQYYFADAALRCYGANFFTAGNTSGTLFTDEHHSRWHGHIKRDLYESAGSDKIAINEWYTTTTKLLTPTAGGFDATIGSEVPGKVLMTYGGSGDSALTVTADTLKVHWNALDTIPGTWLAGTYKWYISHIYDGSQESPVYETTMTSSIVGTTGTKSVCLGVSSNWLNDGTFNKRITGARVYYSDPIDGDGTKYHMLDIDLVKGCRKFNETDWTDWDIYGSNSYECPASLIGTGGTASFMNLADVFIFEDMPKSITYDMLNGYGPTEVTDAKFKCHTVFNNRVWAGNIKQDGKTYPDRIIRSPINFEGNPQYDTFPATHKMDVAANDGDAVMALEGYGDRLLVFKKQSVYVINIAGDGTEFVETKFSDLGVLSPSQVTSTEHGIVWINDKGCYLYTGKEQPVNLIENIFSAKKARLITPDMKWSIAEDKRPSVIYLPRDNKLLISPGMSDGYSKEAYLFDFMKKAWSFGENVLGDFTLIRSNLIVNSQGEALFCELENSSGSATLDSYKWDDTSKGQSEFRLWFKDLDMGQPNIRKKFYKMYLSFRASSTTNVIASFTTNGNYGQSLDFTHTNIVGLDSDNMLTHSATYGTLVSNGDFTTNSGSNNARPNAAQTQIDSTSWFTTHNTTGATILINSGVMTWNNSNFSDLVLYEDIAVVDGNTYEVSFTAITSSIDLGAIGTSLPGIMCYITKANSATIASATHAGLVDNANQEAFVVSGWNGTYNFTFTADQTTNWYVAFRSVLLTNSILPEAFTSYSPANEDVLVNQATVSNVSVKQFDEWRIAELKPTTSSQANNIYSVGLRLDTKQDGSGNNLTVPSDFEIDNLSVVYRKKNIK